MKTVFSLYLFVFYVQEKRFEHFG